MKIAIVYSSNTGNTKIIAEAIKEELNPKIYGVIVISRFNKDKT